MAVDTGDLKPYKSVILAQMTDPGPVVSALLDDAKPLLGLDQEPERLKKERRARKTTVPKWVLQETVDDATGQRFRRLVEDGSDEVSTGYLHYVERRSPGWYAGSGVEDLLNCLLVVVQRRRHVALYLSDNRRRAAFQRRLGHGEDDGFSRLRAIGRTALNGAFVRGPARTLWLSGIHAPVAVKADTKTLSGVDLRDALDPLGDQTYHFTAARSSVPDLLMPVGVAPRSSRIWVGTSRDWTDFCSTMSLLLRHLDSDPPPVGRPLPVLASPVAAADMPSLTDAFELHFLPPELLADDPEIMPEERELMERWAYRSEFEIVASGADSFDARVRLEDREVGELHLALDTSDPEKVRIVEHVVEKHAAADPQAVIELQDVSGRLRWFKVWFETGHALAGGTVFAIRHRDEPFHGFRWVKVSPDYQPKVEKFWSGEFPDDAGEQIGKKESLFCWVRNEWTNPGDSLTTSGGWLSCDDGAMEIADFIHLDDRSDPPVLSLIHVKGAKSASEDRGISVSSYEVVVGQAVKNLRHLDRLHLEEGLEAGVGKKISKLVWHDRQLSDRQAMLAALGKVGTSYRRLVVILQPHVLRTRVEAVRQNPGHADVGRLRQLDTLLLSAQASCRSLGAELLVLSEDL